MSSARPETLASLTRALRLLRLLERSPSGMGLAEVSRETELPKPTALRLLRSLADAGLLVRDGDSGKYLNHPAFWVQMAALLCPAQSLVRDAMAVLRRLARQEHATAMILLPDERRRHALFALLAFSPTGIVMDPSARGPVPLHGPAAGKCYLAHLPENELNEYLHSRLEQVTERTLTAPDLLRRELEEVRRKAYALNLGEVELGLSGVGVPLHHEGGDVIGGISLGYAEPGYDIEYLTARVPPLTRAADRISRLLSYERYQEYMTTIDSAPPLSLPESDTVLADGVVRSVGRAVRLLAVLGRSPRGESPSSLARLRGLDRAAVARILQTMAAEGFVRRHQTSGRYYLDPVGWLRQAPILETTASLDATVQYVLKRLAHHAGATALLVCRDSGNRKALWCTHAFPAEQHAFFRPDATAQVSSPLHATAGGKCLLAWESEGAVSRYMENGLEAKTKHTITSTDQLTHELLLARKRGLAVSSEENVYGVGEVAMPVRGASGEVMAAVAIAPLVYNMTKENVGKWASHLKAVTDVLSRVLTPRWRQQIRRA